ncbi:hypothetical protein F5X99DRAFT_157623 [Biscogniauxia marginata]|nr:hypothetical protein F5X99DRAFT_157623 [Biscogniauxia marginata]
MPPLVPRPRPTTLLLPLRAGPSPATATTTTLARLFSSTAPASSGPGQFIPPESPLFINVPNPPQDQSIEARRDLKPVRGYLPVPRKIFSHRDSHLKPTDEWLRRATPLPGTKTHRGRRRDAAAAAAAEGEQWGPTTSETARTLRPESEYQAWKRRMAANRRENLRSGMTDLWARKQLADSRRRERQARVQAEHREAMFAPEPEDERLTRGSISEALLKTAVEKDPERFTRALASRERTVALAARRSEARRDAVQELYMNARSFIIDEAELEARVGELFAPDYWRKMGSSAGGLAIRNVWDLLGKPRTVAQMLSEVSRSSSELVKNVESEATRTMKRQKQVAEELTGGKMD